MDPSEVKVLIGKITNVPPIVISDDHPEVLALSNISADELVEKLWNLTDRHLIDDYHRELGLTQKTADKPSPGWKLKPHGRTTKYANIGAVRIREGMSDMEVLAAAREGMIYAFNHYETLVEEEGWTDYTGFEGHPLPPGTLLETAKTLVSPNEDGTIDVVYLSKHVCDCTPQQLMEVYWDRRLELDTVARGYTAELLHRDGAAQLWSAQPMGTVQFGNKVAPHPLESTYM